MADPVKGVSDMMRALEQLHEDVKTGAVSESTGKLLLQIRKAQLQTADTNLRFLRMFKGREPKEMPFLTESVPAA